MIWAGSWISSQEPAGRLEADGCFGQRGERESHTPGRGMVGFFSPQSEPHTRTCHLGWGEKKGGFSQGVNRVLSGSGVENDSQAEPGLCWTGSFAWDCPLLQIGEFLNLA